VIRQEAVSIKELKCILFNILFNTTEYRKTTLTLALPPEKVKRLRRETTRTLRRAVPNREGPLPLVGRLRATHPAVEPAALFLRSLMSDMNRAR
jgi:hypothetical protein